MRVALVVRPTVGSGASFEMAAPEPASLEMTAEGDGAQSSATTTPAATTTDPEGWWQRDTSWWNEGDWRWSGWWGNRWNSQRWPHQERFSYATVGTMGDQSGAAAGSASGDRGGDLHPQHQQSAQMPGDVSQPSGAPASSSTTTSSLAPVPMAAGDADVATDPWVEAARDLIGPTARGGRAAANPVGASTATPMAAAPSPDPWQTWRASPNAWNWSYTGGGTGYHGYKGEYGEPPQWPGWSYRRQWTQAIKRWDKLTDVPVFRRAEKVLRTLGWELQTEFEHLSDDQLSSDDYLTHILRIMEMKAGVQEDAEKRSAFRSVLADTSRKRDETLAQFAMRRLRDFTRATQFGLELPADLRVSLLREGAGLSEQNQQNLTTLLRGREQDVDYLALVLSRMDARAERITGHEETSDGAEVFLCETAGGEDHSDRESEDDPAETDVSALEEENFNEDQANYVFAILSGRFEKKKRTWKENKNYKAEMRKDRGSFMKGISGDHPRGASGGLPGRDRDHRGRGPKGTGKQRLSREEMKKISRCRLCDRKGHWAEDCHLSRPQTSTTVTTQRPSGFCYLGPPREQGSGSGWVFMAGTKTVHWSEPEKADRNIEESVAPLVETWNFLTFKSGDAILDIGATQDIIGLPAMEALDRTLEAAGLRSIEVPTVACAPTGIGGRAQVIRSVLVPISPGGVPGVINFLVIQSNVPPLLSVGLLEHLGASFDLVTNQISFEKIGVRLRMGVQDSGHRTIPLVQWSGGRFPVPEELRQQYSLPDNAFDRDCEAPSRYTKERPVVSESVVAQNGSRKQDGGVECFNNDPEFASVSETAHACGSPHMAQHRLPAPVGALHETSVGCSQLLGSGTLQMGSHLEKPKPQFDHDPRPHHESILRTRADKGRNEMEGFHHQGLLCHGDVSNDVLPLDSGGARAKESEERPAILSGESHSGSRGMPAPDFGESREPVRFLDRMSNMWSPALVLLEEGSDHQGEGQIPRTSYGEHRLPRRADGDLLYPGSADTDPELSRGRGGEPGIARSFVCHTGHVGRLPADEHGDEGLGPRPGANAADDESCPGHPGERDGLGRSLCGRSQHGEREDGDRRGAHRGRQPEQLVSSQYGQPQRRPPGGPPGLTWPRWMTLSALSLASSIAPWTHLSAAGKDVLGRHGAGSGSWMVHYPLLGEGSQGGALPEGDPRPQHLRAPWISVNDTGDVPHLTICVWHEVRDEHGRVLCRGPGRIPGPARIGNLPAGTRYRCWNAPRQLCVLESHRDPREAVLGFNGRGEPSPTGPFWLVSAPTLQDWADADGFTCDEVKVAEGEAKNVATSLTAYLRRSHERVDPGKCDFAELITSTPALQAAQERGLRVPPPHERFTEEDGWNLFDKEHRRRFREFQARCQPSFLSVGSQEVPSPSLSQEEMVRAKLEADFLTQAAMNQVESENVFQLRADDESLLWESDKWVQFVAEHPDLRIFWLQEGDGRRVKVATNSSWLGDESDGFSVGQLSPASALDFVYHAHSSAEESLPLDTEKAARQLLLRQDFSVKACLNLLKNSRSALAHRSRKASLVQSGVLKYDVFGQYTHGGMSGITKRTDANKQFALYINEFLTRRGACGPRSSFAITSGARLAYHRDSHNVGQNYVITLGDFSGGQVWVEEENGPDARQVAPGKWVHGRLHSPRQRVLSFSPRKLHGPEPWQGERWSIIAYQTRSARKLNRAQRRHLRELGFDVRGYRSESLSHQPVVRAALLEATGLQSDPSPVYAQISTGDDEEEEGGEDHPARDEQRQRQGALRLLHQPPAATEVEVSEAQMSLIRKLHNNCGHPPTDRFLRTLKAAGALPHVLRYVRDRFHCQECESRRGPIPRRKSPMSKAVLVQSSGVH